MYTDFLLFYYAPAVLNNLGLLGSVSDAAVGHLIGIKVITSSQLYEKNPVIKFAVIEVPGDSGAGGGCSAIMSSSTCSVGEGGTNGAYAKVVVDPADGTPITIRVGGTSLSAATGNNGGASLFGTISAGSGFGGYSMLAGSTPNFATTNRANAVVEIT